MILRRTETEYSASPTTRLPGSIAIERIIAQKVETREPFAVCYCDLDNFKAYNDTYGFAKGDSVIRQTARASSWTPVRNNGRPEDFVGHIGETILSRSPRRTGRTRSARISWARSIGWLPSTTRKRAAWGTSRRRTGRAPGAVPSHVNLDRRRDQRGREITHAAQVADIAAEVKKRAKMTSGSCFVRDRRKTDADQDPR